MKQGIPPYFTIFLLTTALITGLSDPQCQLSNAKTLKKEPTVDFPQVPRTSAYEAYVKYRAGKAIIIHAGGEAFERRHVFGAINIDQEAAAMGAIKLPRLPKTGVEIFTYCY